MSHEREGRYRESGGTDTPGADSELAPGKRTLTQALETPRRASVALAHPVQRRLSKAPSFAPGADLDAPPIADGLAAAFLAPRAPIQARAGAAGVAEPEQVHAAAERGTATPSTSLPYRDELEASLGQDLSAVQAHVGGAAESAAGDMGAEAFATGDHVVLPANPSLHTVAHEVAHVMQQRDGVQLKGGVGEAGDAYERHADDVADAVVRGERAPVGPDVSSAQGSTVVVQRKVGGDSPSPQPSQAARPDAVPSPGEAGADAGESAEPEQLPDLVSVTVNWSGKFDGDLSAVVSIEGTNEIGKGKKGKKGKRTEWVLLATETVLDPDGADGTQAAATSVSVQVPRYAYYRASIDPVTEKPDDRYKRTDVGTKLEPTEKALTIDQQLNIERWNRKNVNDVWDDKRIDESKAADVTTVALFGRHIEVHKEVAPRVAKTNALYEKLPEATKLEIQDSIFVMGGYAVRTTSSGTFSNHSVGFAVDINYSMGTKQNYDFNGKADRKILTQLVQPVVNTDPDMSTFQIMEAEGQDQLQASRVFNERFPAYLADLLGRTGDADILNSLSDFQDASESAEPYAATIQSIYALKLFETITVDDIRKVAKGQKDKTKKRQLELIIQHWSALRAWLFGHEVTDKKHEIDATDRNGKPTRKRVTREKTAVGMIPLREDVLQMFLDTGWQWGGDWNSKKDYMHFEDKDALARVQKQESSNAKPPKR